MLDLTILRIARKREQFKKIQRFIPRSGLDKKTVAVVDDIRRYFADNPKEEVVDLDAFSTLFFNVYHKGLKEDSQEYYRSVIKSMEKDVPESVEKNIVNQLLELDFATQLANACMEYDEDGEIDIIEFTEDLLNQIKRRREVATRIEFADVTSSTIIEEDQGSGISWHLDCFNTHYRKILPGDQYIVAGSPGKGKTSFLAHLNWGMAQELPKNKKIVWFNNEGRRQRIMTRQIQSALNKTEAELKDMNPEDMYTMYENVMGCKDRVQVYDVHGLSTRDLEAVLDKIGIDNVGAIIFDMLDKVNSFSPKDLREDLRLEKLYDWSRELGVRYTAPVFPTSQISKEGAGLLFPSERFLKDSKTGKQGSCDGIIMIGCADDPLTPHERGLSMPKTKSRKYGQPDMREVVQFDEDRGRYIDVGSKIQDSGTT